LTKRTWVRVCGSEEPWEYLTVALERVSAEGDPDLYGKAYYDGLDQHIDDDEGTMLEGFDFEETSSADHANVQQSLARSTLHNSTSLAYRGAMLCVTAYGPNGNVPTHALLPNVRAKASCRRR
jgi:hypothetical protein